MEDTYSVLSPYHLSASNPFLKNKPHQVGINNDSTGKFKIHPFGEEKANEVEGN
jgi:hypothetical protein